MDRQGLMIRENNFEILLTCCGSRFFIEMKTDTRGFYLFKKLEILSVLKKTEDMEMKEKIYKIKTDCGNLIISFKWFDFSEVEVIDKSGSVFLTSPETEAEKAAAKFEEFIKDFEFMHID